MTAPELLKRFEQRRLARDAAQMAVTQAEAETARTEELVEVADQVRVFFNLLAEAQRKEMEQKVEGLVDYGVQMVFGPHYRFKVVSEFKGKSVRTEFFILNDGLQLPILDATGGGVGDVVAFLLRVVMLCLVRPVQRRVLVLDEPFKFVSAAHFQTLGELLRELTAQLGIQLVMVTHKVELVEPATTIIRVSKGPGGSQATVEHAA